MCQYGNYVYKISFEIQHDLSMINLPANLELRCWLETALPSWDQSSVTEDTYKDGASLHLTHQIHSGLTLLNSHAAPVAKISSKFKVHLFTKTILQMVHEVH